MGPIYELYHERERPADLESWRHPVKSLNRII